MGRFCKGPMTKKGNLAFNGHPPPWGCVERIEGVPAPPLQQKLCQKNPKLCQRCQEVLRRFLATLPLIRRVFAPDLDRAHPQGVL